jgi:hypothetical protein
LREHVNGTRRDQTVLFPNTIDQYYTKNPVRFIDSLNLEKLGFNDSVSADAGRPYYNPSDLLKLYIYGYLNQVTLNWVHTTMTNRAKLFGIT